MDEVLRQGGEALRFINLRCKHMRDGHEQAKGPSYRPSSCWLYDADWFTWYEEYVYPVWFSGAAPGDHISCPYCGGEVSGDYAYWNRKRYRGTITIYLGPGIHVVERYGLKVTFTVSYGPLTLSVELWKGNRDREGRRPTRS